MLASTLSSNTWPAMVDTTTGTGAGVMGREVERLDGVTEVVTVLLRVLDSVVHTMVVGRL